MTASTVRDYDNVTHTGASNTTSMLRVPVGLDSADYQDLPLEKFLTVEATGVGVVDRTSS